MRPKGRPRAVSAGSFVVSLLIVTLSVLALTALRAGCLTANSSNTASWGRGLLSGEALLDNRTCPRMLWLSGLQALTSKGSESRYLDTSSSYMRYYAAALRSARANAPTILPVLVFFNEPPDHYLEWVEAQDCVVIKHQISFHDHIADAVQRDPDHPKLAKIDHLVASYARLDVPAIMDKVRAELARRQMQNVDTDYALWTDPDVLFERDIDSCTLPKPRLVSISAETIPGTVANCGVMYFNIANFKQTQPALLAYADSQKWKFDDDQDLFRHFYKRWMISGLPDSFNYKPYWGEREYIRPAPFYADQALAEVFIIHTHGPKPEAALCVIDFIRTNSIPVADDRDMILAHLPNVTEACNLHGLPWLDIIVRLIASCVTADGGQMYKRVLELHNSLCPGLCWK